jgi:hypothetical protein
VLTIVEKGKFRRALAVFETFAKTVLANSWWGGGDISIAKRSIMNRRIILKIRGFKTLSKQNIWPMIFVIYLCTNFL